MEFEIILGKDLPDDTIEQMNAQRIHEYGENTKNFRKNEQQSTFFFLKDDAEWKAFGMLKPLILTFRDQPYDILGIGNIIAVDKGNGHGKTLMTEIKHYLQAHDAIGLGFCERDRSGFYLKCAYEVTANLSQRFRYQFAHVDGSREQLNRPLDVLCFDPNQQFMELLKSSDDLIYSNVPFW